MGRICEHTLHMCRAPQQHHSLQLASFQSTMGLEGSRPASGTNILRPRPKPFSAASAWALRDEMDGPRCSTARSTDLGGGEGRVGDEAVIWIGTIRFLGLGSTMVPVCDAPEAQSRFWQYVPMHMKGLMHAESARKDCETIFHTLQQLLRGCSNMVNHQSDRTCDRLRGDVASVRMALSEADDVIT